MTLRLYLGILDCCNCRFFIPFLQQTGNCFYDTTPQGQHISFTQQIQQVMDTFQQFILSKDEDEASEFISNSIFYISIGTNDFIHYYLRNVSNVQSRYLPWSFNQFLANTMKQEIKVPYFCAYLAYLAFSLHLVFGFREGKQEEKLFFSVFSFLFPH